MESSVTGWCADLQARSIRHAFVLTGLVPPDRMPELLAGVDAVIHPSLREGLARVLPQALLVGRPVISYDLDGAREVVLPETGILLQPRDLTWPCDRNSAARRRAVAAPHDGPGRSAQICGPVPA